MWFCCRGPLQDDAIEIACDPSEDNAPSVADLPPARETLQPTRPVFNGRSITIPPARRSWSVRTPDFGAHGSSTIAATESSTTSSTVSTSDTKSEDTTLDSDSETSDSQASTATETSTSTDTSAATATSTDSPRS
ncbi:MAG: uncharacterized protein KVP18_001093 [Porospora cf. gigantea A]|uniref:uncharacterized protein n=1 Tax=Porospora cf. gigantea A TaxID=2853593 RepID=UPI0035595091|nr:MAG: hypothetical protein KVP18_001093 [Porospora cf. gigantea A]